MSVALQCKSLVAPGLDGCKSRHSSQGCLPAGGAENVGCYATLFGITVLAVGSLPLVALLTLGRAAFFFFLSVMKECESET